MVKETYVKKFFSSSYLCLSFSGVFFAFGLGQLLDYQLSKDVYRSTLVQRLNQPLTPESISRLEKQATELTIEGNHGDLAPILCLGISGLLAGFALWDIKKD